MQIVRRTGAADDLLTNEFPEPFGEPTVVVNELTTTALILGSSQRAEQVIDPDAVRGAGVDVARRYSGGGAVLLTAGRNIWLDLLLPRDDPRWSDDVIKAPFWLGVTWADALRDLGVPAEVHASGLRKTRWGALVCFGALGAGEVTINGRKVLGISQRRTRGGARFQCLIHEYWDPTALLDMLALTPQQRTQALADLMPAAAGPGVDLTKLKTAVLDRLANSPS